MKKLKLYLDTSIINFVIAEDSLIEKQITHQLLREIEREKYEVFISEVVLLEISRSPEAISQKLKSIVKDLDAEELSIDQESQMLANRYIEEGIIPEKYENDALHIAIASVNNLDVIVSWNFRHIVKLKTKREVTGVNAIMGYKEIEIYSPWEVVENV